MTSGRQRLSRHLAFLHPAPGRGGLDRLRAWGWPAALGGACLLGACLLWAVWLPGQQQRIDAAQDALSLSRQQARQLMRLQMQVQVQVRASDQADTPLAQGTEAPWQAFLAGFGPADEGRARVAALWARAQAQGLTDARSEFAMEPVAELPLQRLRLALPLSGPYPALRRFMAEALAADPALSLDGLRLERLGGQDVVVQAQTQWSFWTRRP